MCGRKVSRVWCGRIVECLCGCINKQQNRNRNEQPCSILASLGHCQDKGSSSSSHDKASSSRSSNNYNSNINTNSNNPGQGTSFNGSPCMSVCESVCRPPVAPTASVSVSEARPAASNVVVVVTAVLLLLCCCCPLEHVVQSSSRILRASPTKCNSQHGNLARTEK